MHITLHQFVLLLSLLHLYNTRVFIAMKMLPTAGYFPIFNGAFKADIDFFIIRVLETKSAQIDFIFKPQ